MISADEVRRVALALPEAEERETWGHPTFRVREKIFVILSADGRSASVKSSPQEQAMLIASDPESFAVAAYTGRFGWVAARLETADPDVVRGIVVEAWRRTAPKRLRGLQTGNHTVAE